MRGPCRKDKNTEARSTALVEREKGNATFEQNHSLIIEYHLILYEREKAKNKRISQANTEQSQLIQQRKNNLPPISFESNEDTLDGFDLAEFEPR